MLKRERYSVSEDMLFGYSYHEETRKSDDTVDWTRMTRHHAQWHAFLTFKKSWRKALCQVVQTLSPDFRVYHLSFQDDDSGLYLSWHVTDRDQKLNESESTRIDVIAEDVSVLIEVDIDLEGTSAESEQCIADGRDWLYKCLQFGRSYLASTCADPSV